MKKSSFVFVTLTILISLFGVSCATIWLHQDYDTAYNLVVE